MSSWLGGIFDRGALATARQVAAFTEARQAVLADNMANIDTAGYKVRDLPVAEFQQALGRAIERSRQGGGSALRLEASRHIRVGPDGGVRFEPVERRDANLLFHDGGNRSIEQEMSDMVKNTLMHRVAVEVLRTQANMLEAAIRGKL
jgi:flagellar basal-body rod protein FlgB